MPDRIDIAFRLNGVGKRTSVAPEMSALEMLRDVIGLTGTKYGCGEGECGACTILVDGLTVNSCLMFAADCDGREVMTVEGINATPRGEALRRAFVERGAVQCGFCTPGFMLQAWHLLERNPQADEAAIQRGIEGNLCRCTGYKKIVEAIAATGAEETGQTRGQTPVDQSKETSHG
jgi:carbon-monoxide dehydrogenase small subunit